jgi:hypothetical protein
MATKPAAAQTVTTPSTAPGWRPIDASAPAGGQPTTAAISDKKPLTFQGYVPPFRKKDQFLDALRNDEYVDATGKNVPREVFLAWQAVGSPVGEALRAWNPPRPEDATGKGSTVDAVDTRLALDSYRGAIDKANKQYDSVLGYTPMPTAQGTQAPVQAGTVQLDTAQADQTRGQQQGALGYLDQSAQGKGAAGQLAAARLAQALRAGAAQGAGIAQGATGAARKGATRAGILAANQAALAGGSKVAELEAAAAVQAQGQYASALQGVRAGDITQSATAADVGAANANRDLTAQTTRNDQGLRAQGQDEDQRIANERLKLDASKAATDAAAGLLNENERQAQLKLAYDKLNLAVDQAEKSFWRGIITSLISRVAGAVVPGPPQTPAAAHGGLVTKPTQLLVGEAGPEIIVPVKQDMPAQLAQALSVGSKPFDRQQAPDLSALLSLLQGRAGPAPPQVPPHLIAVLAAGNARARKASY